MCYSVYVATHLQDILVRAENGSETDQKAGVIMARVAKKDNARIVGVTFYCGNLDKEVVISAEDYELNWSGYEAECDMCGSHGDFSVDFKCECGSRHEISLKSW